MDGARTEVTMTMKDKKEISTPSPNTAAQVRDVPEASRVMWIEVSITDDGKPSVDIDPAIVPRGGEVVWHTPPGQQQPLRIVFEAGSPIMTDKGNSVTPAGHAEKQSPGKAVEGSVGDVALQSSLQQVVRASIREDAADDMWTCVVETGGPLPSNIQRLLTGIVVRPPKGNPPLMGSEQVGSSLSHAQHRSKAAPVLRTRSVNGQRG